jgi:NAD(P)H-dependent flavin oxidoreductase YrpB (nitropropane dioxygenase family)
VTLPTPFTSLLHIAVPVMQAPIGGCSCPELAAAVSNAGGLGMLALSWDTPEVCQEKVRRTRELTQAPFGVNFVLEWDQMARLEVCLDAGVKIVSLFWGNPAAYVREIHSSGASTIVHVGSPPEARRAVDLGADVVLCQGFEAGGHVRGTVGSIALIPTVVDVVSPVPVVAAGGFGDGRGLAAALSLGAAGVCMGTRFVASEEARAHPGYKQRVLDCQPAETVHTTLFDGGWENAAHRVIRNSTVREWESAGRAMRGLRPGEGERVGRSGGREISRYDDFAPVRDMEGEWERCALYAGESVGVVHDIRRAGDIVRDVAHEAVEVIRALAGRT